jgi:hypothetical protein
MKKIVIILLVLFLLPAALFGYDLGLVANIGTGYGGQSRNDPVSDFRVDFWPHFSSLIGDNIDFVATTGFSFSVFNEDFFFVPELLHTELIMRFDALEIRMGRLNYSDPLSFVADGLFDGLQFFHNNRLGNFNIGAWYTGFLYKKNANITMTSDEQLAFNQPLDYDNFSDTYFAPRRMIMALGWEHFSIGEFVYLNTALITQFDLSGNLSGNYNSQYLIAKTSIPLASLRMEFGGAVELSQQESEFGLGFAGMFGLYWLFPGEFNSMFSVTGKITGGAVNENDLISPFVPITATYYGFILRPKMSGISILTLDYSARLYQNVGVSVSLSYFVRNDLVTFRGYPLLPDIDQYIMGTEVYGRVAWSPFSDLQFNLGGGTFFSFIGNTGPERPFRWRIELSALRALY